MNPVRKQKLLIVGSILVGSIASVGLLLVAFDKGLNAFMTPTEVVAGKVNGSHAFRLGGMVKKDSLVKTGTGTRIEFIATDFNEDIPVVYTGVLPDLFREGQGLTADGHMDANGVFQADIILAKHDENYMSKEVKAAMDAAEKKKAAKLATEGVKP